MTPDLKPIVNYFKSKLAGERAITRELIEKVIDADGFFGGMEAATRSSLVRHLESSFVIVQNEGSFISNDCEPWLAGRKSDIDFFYWHRLRDFLIDEDVLPPNVVSRLDTETDRILDGCGNPASTDPWFYRGMVMGHVQSGKTTNYSALITKAADAGYKVIILLAGLTNSLRSQTQQRIDEYFIGRKSVYNAAAQAPLKLRNFGNGRNKDPDFGTTREQDFSKERAVIGAPFSALKEPKIFVIKKNKSVLENLNTWINDQAHGQQVDYPLLLIDDEADNASINTNKDPKRSTAINSLIRELMQKFRQSSYVGYTATPFANIFIEPDSQDDMQNDDLFPKNFIHALEAPDNYCGAGRIFSVEGDLRRQMVTEVDDYVDILPLGHKKDWPLECLPPSLELAIRAFVIARAIRVLRGDGTKHCSMMINVSRLNDIQAKVEGLAYIYLKQLKDAITVSARSSDPLADPLITDLRETFEGSFEDLEFGFGDLLEIFQEAVATIVVTTVNMRGGRLDYERQSEQGLHVIAIGGLALSRGLTLEGLVTSYILRNVGASDTLMQMARWFGYRRGYEDLCRLYLPAESTEHYRETSIAMEELRAEVKNMQDSGLTPYDFGLKVRQSPTGIRITAANKMRSASTLNLAADFSGRYVQGHAIFNDQTLNEKHCRLVADFLASCGPHAQAPGADYYWRNISGNKISGLLSSFRFPEKVIDLAVISGSNTLLGDYISDRLDDELRHWDVAISSRQSLASNTQPVSNILPGTNLFPSQRSAAKVEGRIFQFTGTSNAVGDQDTVKIGLEQSELVRAESMTGTLRDKINKFNRVRKRPLLVIHLVSTGPQIEGSKLENYCVSLSFCMPTTHKPVREQAYQVNEVFRRTMLEPFDAEAEDDADYMLEAGL